MMNQISKTFRMILTLLLIASAAAAQQSYRPPADDFESRSDGPAKPDKKDGSIFRRPAKETPADQLAYARSLEENGRLRRAGNQYDALVHRWHFSEEAPAAQFAYARVLYERRRYERAFKEFQYMMHFYSGLFDFSVVLDYQLRIANHIMGQRWATFGVFPGFEAQERALPLFEAIIANAPNWEKTPAIRLMIGTIYENTGEYIKAVAAFESVFQHHPGSEEAQVAAFRKAICLADLSDKSPRDERRCREALSAWASFLASYPRSENREEASRRMDGLKERLEEMYYQRALYYDAIEKRPVSALIGYREFIKQFPSSERTPAVMQRIETLDRQQNMSERE